MTWTRTCVPERGMYCVRSCVARRLRDDAFAKSRDGGNVLVTLPPSSRRLLRCNGEKERE